MDWKTALQNMALPARSYGDPAGQIFNCSWICYTSVASPEVLAKKGSRNVYIDVQNGCGRENITVLVGGSAAGTSRLQIRILSCLFLIYSVHLYVSTSSV
jgi:hypothetical protein